MKNNNIREHTLVCINHFYDNTSLIESAARISKAFGGNFTALYVNTSKSKKMTEHEKQLLNENIKTAQKLGADFTTVHGDDIPFVISEYARISGVTRIIIDSHSIKPSSLFYRDSLEKLIKQNMPDTEIYIIPSETGLKETGETAGLFSSLTYPSFVDLLVTALILLVSTLTGLLFHRLGFTEPNIITLYILGALLTSVFTTSHLCSLISSMGSVLMFNFFFTEPLLDLHVNSPEYPVTFAIMFFASILTGTLANQLKDSASKSSQSAFRTKVLFDTNQLLHNTQDNNEIMNITANKLMELLDRDIIVYPTIKEKLSRGYIFSDSQNVNEDIFFSPYELQAVEWTYNNRLRSGKSTELYPDANCLYIDISIANRTYGVVGIHLDNREIDSLENSFILSILGECALAIENNINAKEKEEAALLAKNEQLRSTLLRAISHDLRTPLTSISGNASNLLTNYDRLDDSTRINMFSDIFDDSQWLIGLVENLLSITRLEEKSLSLNTSIQVLNEIVDEALRHMTIQTKSHQIITDYSDDIILCKVDAKLIIQVIINLVENAIKYTPKDSVITIITSKDNGYASVSVKDNGQGIAENIKPHVFDMFFTGEQTVADSHRSLGLGLYLCRSIIEAHGGLLTLEDNIPHGTVFTFTLPLNEVNIND